MKPGKPLAFGQVNLNGKEIFHIGLPGNSVSSYVCFELFIRPILMKMQGIKNIFRKTVTARVDKEIKNKSISIRALGGDDIGEMNIDELINFIKKEEEKSYNN